MSKGFFAFVFTSDYLWLGPMDWLLLCSWTASPHWVSPALWGPKPLQTEGKGGSSWSKFLIHTDVVMLTDLELQHRHLSYQKWQRLLSISPFHKTTLREWCFRLLSSREELKHYSFQILLPASILSYFKAKSDLETESNSPEKSEQGLFPSSRPYFTPCFICSFTNKYFH